MGRYAHAPPGLYAQDVRYRPEVDSAVVPGWVEKNETVLTGNTPTTWTDLDLSAHTGKQVVWALIAVQATAGFSAAVAFRTNGDTTDLWAAAEISYGVAYFLVPTDANGVVEWKASAENACNAILIGYVEGVAVEALTLNDGALASGASTLDASSKIDDQALVMVKTQQKVGMSGKTMSYRSLGPVDGETWIYSSLYTWAYANKVYNLAQDTAHHDCVLSYGAQLLGVITTAAGVQTTAVMHSYVKLGSGLLVPEVDKAVVQAWGNTPTDWTNLDLSDAIGAQKSLVFLKVKANQYAALMTRADGSSLAGGLYTGVQYGRNVEEGDRCFLVIVNCNGSGVIEIHGSSTSGTAQHEITVLGWIPEA